jgi:hypothetical protein
MLIATSLSLVDAIGGFVMAIIVFAFGIVCFRMCSTQTVGERNFQKNKVQADAVFAGIATYKDSSSTRPDELLLCKLHPDDVYTYTVLTDNIKEIKEKYKLGDTIGIYYNPNSPFRFARSVEYPLAPKKDKLLLVTGYTMLTISVIWIIMIIVKMFI